MSEERPGLPSSIAILVGLIALILGAAYVTLKGGNLLMGELVKKNQVQAAEMRRNAEAHINEDREASEATRRRLCADRDNPAATPAACRNTN